MLPFTYQVISVGEHFLGKVEHNPGVKESKLGAFGLGLEQC